mgnify:CR=1 FL=1
MDTSAPEVAIDAVLKASAEMPKGSEIVRGYDFNNGLDYAALLATYKVSGFQATNFGKAVDEINNMVGEYFRFPQLVCQCPQSAIIK